MLGLPKAKAMFYGARVKAGTWFKFSPLQLINKGDKPLVLDWVKVVPYSPGVYQHSKFGANIKFKRAWYAVARHEIVPNAQNPKVLKSMVPAVGHKVPPYANMKGHAPALIMKVGPGNAPVTVNKAFKVGYHTSSGKRYVAMFYVHFIICIKRKVTQAQCNRIVPPVEPN